MSLFVPVVRCYATKHRGMRCAQDCLLQRAALLWISQRQAWRQQTLWRGSERGHVLRTPRRTSSGLPSRTVISGRAARPLLHSVRMLVAWRLPRLRVLTVTPAFRCPSARRSAGLLRPTHRLRLMMTPRCGGARRRHSLCSGARSDPRGSGLRAQPHWRTGLPRRVTRWRSLLRIPPPSLPVQRLASGRCSASWCSRCHRHPACRLDRNSASGSAASP